MFNLSKNHIYLKKHDVILDKDKDGIFFPVLYKHNGVWRTPVDGDIIQDWVVYVKHALKIVDPITFEEIDGNLYAYQWGSTINIINAMIENNTKFFDIEWCRQSGKTYILEHLVGFLTIFARRYKNRLKGDVWTTITVSHKEDSAKKNFRMYRKRIETAVEIYNNLYGNEFHKLIYGNYKVGGDSKTTIQKDWHFQVDVIMGDTSKTWADAYALTAKSDNDGFSSAMTISDESILINSKQFMRSILPFSTVNGGSIIVTGISSTDSTCLQYVVHNMDKAIKFIYDRDKIYNLMKLTSPSEAETFKNSTDEQIEAVGGKNSTEALTNYFMSWEITDGKFTTREQLKKNNVLSCSMEDINYRADYVVGGVDLSVASDYTVLTIAEAYKKKNAFSKYGLENIEMGYEFNVKEIKTYNPDRQRMDIDVVAKKMAKDFQKYKIDMVMMDNTSTQNSIIQAVYRECKRLGINTLIIPYNFAGTNEKLQMMSYLESMMFSGRCKLPNEDYLDYHKSFSILYEELLALRKEKRQGKQNVQFDAPKGMTDDHVMSLAMTIYCLAYVEKLKSKRKMLEIGTIKLFPKFNKFKLLKDIEEKQRAKFYAIPF